MFFRQCFVLRGHDSKHKSLIKLPIKMSNIICTICQELITQSPENVLKDDLVVLGMTCGHVFHFSCIKQWFIRSGNGDEDASIGHCPCCQTQVSLHHGLRLFHSSDEAEVVEEKDCRQCQALIKLGHEQAETAEAEESDVRKLRCENAKKTAELQKVQKQLEDEKKPRQRQRWKDQDDDVSDDIRINGEDLLEELRNYNSQKKNEELQKVQKQLEGENKPRQGRWIKQNDDVSDEIRQKGEDILNDIRQKGADLLEEVQHKGDELLKEIRQSGDNLRDGYGTGDSLHDILSRGQGLLDNFRRTGDTLRNDIQRAGDAFRNDISRARDALNSTAQQDCTIV